MPTVFAHSRTRSAICRLNKSRHQTKSCLFVSLQLEELTVGAGSASNDWAITGPPIGISGLPDGWAALRRLRRLALRGHNMLRCLPDWLLKRVSKFGCLTKCADPE